MYILYIHMIIVHYTWLVAWHVSIHGLKLSASVNPRESQGRLRKAQPNSPNVMPICTSHVPLQNTQHVTEWNKMKKENERKQHIATKKNMQIDANCLVFQLRKKKPKEVQCLQWCRLAHFVSILNPGLADFAADCIRPEATGMSTLMISYI